MALKREIETLKRSMTNLEMLISHLRNSPENIANDALQKLRTSSDIDSVLPIISPKVQNAHLSEQTTALAYLPPFYSHQELELIVQHPKAYPTLDPTKDQILSRGSGIHPAKRTKLSGLHKLGNEISYSSQSLSSNSSPDVLDTSFAKISDIPNIKPITFGGYIEVPYTVPNIRPQLTKGWFDAQLSHVNIALWTRVPVSNQFAAGAISLYLDTDHSFLGLFNAEWFVGALVGGTLDFCSPFLVSSLLAFACVSFYNFSM
jgi:hypothetical protein